MYTERLKNSAHIWKINMVKSKITRPFSNLEVILCRIVLCKLMLTVIVIFLTQ